MNKTLKSRYKHIKERCYNENSKSYHNYGGRGIKMCDLWLKDYQAFEEWCLQNGFQEGLAIDRIDNNGNYSPENCRFVTLKENNQNRRSTKFFTINGMTKNLQQWCDYYGIKRGTVVERLGNGWSIEEALTTKPKTDRDRKSLIGKRFGHLVVIEYAGDKNIGLDHNSRWICMCDCGNTTMVGSWKLKSGHTKSCGCLASEKARKRMLERNPMKERNDKNE